MGKRDMLDPVRSCLLTDMAVPLWGRYDSMSQGASDQVSQV